MNAPDSPQSASPEEEARVAGMPAVFANKIYVTPLPAGPHHICRSAAAIG